MMFDFIAIKIAALALAPAFAAQAPVAPAIPSPSPAPPSAVSQVTSTPEATSTPVATASPVAVPVVSATPSAAPAVLPPAERRPYMGADGAMHYPVDGRGQPAITCVPLYVCDIALEASETVLNVATGDSARWLIASAQAGPGGATPHVLVKPTATNLHTNLLVTTSRRVYYIFLNSAATTPFSRLAFFYPEDEAAAAAAAANAERMRDAARAAELPLRPSGAVDTAFRQWGDASLLPAKVYADAGHTFVEYARLPQDLPVLFAVSPEGSDQIVNYRVKDTLFIVDGTPRDVDLVVDAGTGRRGRGERRAHIRHL